MNASTSLDLGRIAQDLQIRKAQVEATLALLDEGNTLPFIARYRQEHVGGLPLEALYQIENRIRQQRQLQDRKQTLVKNLQLQGKLTEELQRDLLAADSMRRLDDLYLPFKPKKKALSAAAKERGLEPVALAIWNRDPSIANFAELLPTFVNPEKGLATPEDVQAGVQQILAELLVEAVPVREAARRVLWETGKLFVTRSERLGEGQGLEYKDYFQFNEPIRHIPPHRVLAINRGEKENALRGQLQWNADALRTAVLEKTPPADHPHVELLKNCLPLGVEQVLLPSLEREIRRDLTDMAEEHALEVFARNLRRLLLQPPIRGKRVLAIDPGFRSGCRLVVLDEHGQLLEHDLVHPHPQPPRREERRKAKEEKAKSVEPAAAPCATTSAPAEAPAAVSASETPASESSTTSPAEPTPAAQEPPEANAPGSPVAEAPPAGPSPRDTAKARMVELVGKHGVHLFAIGSGSACRETEELISELIAGPLPELAYVIVNEAGASHYSASSIGREEFPELDTSVRATISIGRRLQDPLSELVKIDPQNIGVGLYQHDVGEKRLREALELIFQACVNHVGVDLNTANVALLRHVAGLNPLSARGIVEHRKAQGPFRNRAQLKSVPGISETAYSQAAGFVKVEGGDQPLDRAWIHPESYPLAAELLARAQVPPEAFVDAARQGELRPKLEQVNFDQAAQELQSTLPVLYELAGELVAPGRDPRDELPEPIFKKGILRFEDLKPGMELRGTVLNVVDFGAFVDVGLKDSGLVHISQLANRFVKSPHDMISVGDVVTVWVLTVDQDRHRVSLTMIQPGSERRHEERQAPQQRRPQPQGQDQGQGDQRGDRSRRPPPRRQPAPSGGQDGQHRQGAPGRRPPPARRQQHQRVEYHPPRRERPPPELTEEALQGEQPLRTFAELKALYEAKKKE